MTTRTWAILALVITLGALGASIAWAVGQGQGQGPAWAHGPMMGDQPTGQAQPVDTLTAAKRRAQRFADRLGLRAGEVMQFRRNFYVELTDARGRGATEVLIDPSTGAVSLEYGPAMMWNTRYGMMGRVRGEMMGRYGRAYGGGTMMGTGGSGRMMGGTRSTSAGTATVSAARAGQIAARWLATNRPGSTPGPVEPFPGYYTLHTLHSGKVTGMISVNASTGVVMPHWWHGEFVAMSE